MMMLLPSTWLPALLPEHANPGSSTGKMLRRFPPEYCTVVPREEIVVLM